MTDQDRNIDLLSRLRDENRALRDEVEALRELSFQDPLTGLRNRRYFDQRLAAEIDRAARHGEALSLVVADVDDFKAFNDTWGHAIGDEVLIAVARFLERHAREHDVVFRLGGDELAMLLPAADALGCARLMGRLRGDLDAGTICVAGEIVSLSLGGASLVGTRCDPVALYGTADRAMYRDKETRRRLLPAPEPARRAL